MFDLTPDTKIDAVDAPVQKDTLKGEIPLQDAFKKHRFCKGADRSDLYAEDISLLGTPYLVNQVVAYALEYSHAQGVEYVTLSLCMSIAKAIGIDTENVLFNKRTFLQQLKAQVKADKHLFPVIVHTGKAPAKGDKVLKAESKFKAFIVNPDNEDRLRACITHC